MPFILGKICVRLLKMNLNEMKIKIIIQRVYLVKSKPLAGDIVFRRISKQSENFAFHFQENVLYQFDSDSFDIIIGCLAKMSQAPMSKKRKVRTRFETF